MKKTIHLFFLLPLVLAGCSTQKSVNIRQSPIQNTTYTGSSKHWTATFQVMPNPSSNSSKSASPDEILTVKYKYPNSAPKSGVTWSLKTPNVKVGGSGGLTNREILSKGQIAIPSKKSVLTMKVTWDDQTESWNLTSH